VTGRDIRARRFAEPARLQKIALQIDGDQHGSREVEFDRRSTA
jgi:hypothetical protein